MSQAGKFTTLGRPSHSGTRSRKALMTPLALLALILAPPAQADVLAMQSTGSDAPAWLPFLVGGLVVASVARLAWGRR